MTTVIQRPLRGSRISTFYPVKNLPSLASLDSAFQLQEYISLLIRLDVHDVNAIVSLPGNPSAKDKDKEMEMEVNSEKKGGESEKDVEVDKGKGEPTVDEACWIYEQLRRLAQDLSHPLITTLQQECTRASCPEMKAGEWLYLCVAHGNDGAMEHCCAIDYILHTVDSATALLNSPRTFPSRLQIPVASHRHFSSLARRLGRIFAHAYFHHREAFEQAEAESSLYARFLALTERFDLVPAEFLVIPTDGGTIGGVGESLGLGPAPSRSSRDDYRRPNEFDRGYHQQQQQQQRTRYDIDLGKFHHGSESSLQHQLYPNLSDRNSSPPGPSESSSGGIGESPSPSSRARFGRLRTGTMVFSEAEANVVTDELAGRSSTRDREREPQKIELLERDGDPMALKTVVPTALAHEEEESQFEINLTPEDVVGSIVEMAVLSSAPAEVEANVSSELLSHPSTIPSTPVAKEEVTPASTSIVADQPKEDLVEPTTLAEVKSDDDGLGTPSIPMEMTAVDTPSGDDNVSIAESTSIPREAPETSGASTTEQEAVTDDKETIPPSIIINDVESPTTVPPASVTLDAITVEAPNFVEPEVETKLEPMKIEPTSEASLDEVPADKAQPEVVVDADKPIVEPPSDAATKTEGGEKPSVAVGSIADEGKIETEEEKTKLNE